MYCMESKSIAKINSFILIKNDYFAEIRVPKGQFILRPRPSPAPASTYWLAIARVRAIATVCWESPVANIRNVIIIFFIIASRSAADIGIWRV